jgi:hypothetical protein
MTTDLPVPVRAAIDAANANDTDAFLACFPPDGVVDDWGREFAGYDEIRGWSDREFIGVKVNLKVVQVAIDDVTSWSPPRWAGTASAGRPISPSRWRAAVSSG